MAVATITGPVYSSTGTYDFISSSIVFELSEWDVQAEVGLFASGPVIVPIDEFGNFSVDLMVNSEAVNGTHYQCFLQYRRTDGTEWIREPIGIFTLVAGGTYQLSELQITPINEKTPSQLDAYTLCAAFADLSEQWASQDEDVLVDGVEYSSKHYAAKAASAVATTIGNPDENFLSAYTTAREA